MLRKISLASMVLVVSLFLARSVISIEPLVVAPQSLELTIAEGRLDTCRLVVINSDHSSVSIKTDFDDQWMWIYPSEFKIPSGEAKSVLAIFFIPREENPQRQGEIVFRTEDGEKQAKVKVAISAPAAEQALRGAGPKIIATAVEKETKLEELEREIKAKSEKIEQLKKEIEEMKLSYEEIVKNLRNEKELLQSELQEKESQIAGLSKPLHQYIGGEGKSPDEKRTEEMGHLYELLAKSLTEELKRDEVQLAWLDDKLSIVISGLLVFNSGEIYPKKEGSLILEKIGYILKEKANPDKQIIIKGHSDALPIRSNLRNKFPSNWELSAGRAATIARILQWRIGIDGKCLTATGCSFYSPLASNEDWQGRAKNRRIEIVISNKGGVE